MFLNIDAKDPTALALKDNEGNQITYGELAKEMKRAGEKVVPRSVVFILCKNTVGAMVGYLSSIEKGAVPLNLSNRIDKELFSHLMETYFPSYLWVPEEDKAAYEAMAQEAAGASAKATAGATAGAMDGTTVKAMEEIDASYGYVLLKTNNVPYPLHEDLEFLMTTSGSTGSPKLVRYKKGHLEANAKNVALAWGWTKEERPVCDLGMQYTMGLNVINTHLYVGATVLLTNYNLMSADFWDFIKTEKATNFTGVPFSYEIFFRLHFERMDLPYLTTLSEGGGKLTDKRFKALAEYAAKTGKRFVASFGTTETSARFAMLPAELALQKIGSIGKAIPEGRMFLVDETGTVLTDPVAEGELCYEGPNVTMGYAVCKEDLQKEDEFKGVFHTGDLARRDEDGCYYVTGRMSRFLKLLSYRVSLDQAETLIQQAFNIECACSGTDQRMNIYITDGSKKNEVLEFIAEKTKLYKALFKVYVVEELLRNDSGKVRYKEMDERYAL